MLRLICGALLLAASCCYAQQQNNTNTAAADPAFQLALGYTIFPQFIKMAQTVPMMFNLVSYATQAVDGGGTNIFAKLLINPGEYAHLRIYKPVANQQPPMTLVAYQRNKKQTDPISFFQKNSDPFMSTTTTTTGAPSNSLLDGGSGNVVDMNADQSIRTALADGIQDQFIVMANYTPAMFNLISYNSQSTGSAMGTNYFAKVQLSPVEYAHLRIFRPPNFPRERMRLIAYQRGKQVNDPVNYFIYSDNGPQTKPTTTTTSTIAPAAMNAMTGPLSRKMKVNADVNQLTQGIFPDYIDTAGSIPDMFTPLVYRTQKVPGGNMFYVIVQTSVDDAVLVKIFRPTAPLAGLNVPGQFISFTSGYHPNDEIPDSVAQPMTTTTTMGTPWPQDLGVAQMGSTDDTQAMVMGALAEFVRYNPTYKPAVFLAILTRPYQANPRINFVKVQTDISRFVHLKIERPPGTQSPRDTQLLGWKLGKAYDDPIDYF